MNRNRLSLFLFSLCFVCVTGLSFSDAIAGEVIGGAFGGTKPMKPAPTITLTFGVSLDSREFPEAKEMLSQAIRAVSALAPRGVRIQGSNSDIVNFQIEVTEPKLPQGYPEPHRFQTGYFDSIAADVDSATYIPAMVDPSYGPFAVHLYWDRIVNEPARGGDSQGKRVRRFDAFTRLVAALSREIYGSVLMAQTRPDLLPLTDMRHLRSDAFVKKDQLVFRRSAYEAGIEALKIFDAIIAHEIPDKAMRQDIELALGRENRNLIGNLRQFDKLMSETAAASPEKTEVVRSLSGARCERLFQPLK